MSSSEWNRELQQEQVEHWWPNDSLISVNPRVFNYGVELELPRVCASLYTIAPSKFRLCYSSVTNCLRLLYTSLLTITAKVQQIQPALSLFLFINFAHMLFRWFSTMRRFHRNFFCIDFLPMFFYFDSRLSAQTSQNFDRNILQQQCL